MKSLLFTAVLAITAFAANSAMAATSANASSPLGINLNGVAYYDPEQPFLNIFKTTAISQSNPGGWITLDSNYAQTNESQYLQLDSDGYPTTLAANSSDPNSPQKFDRVCAILNVLPNSNAGAGVPYLSGQYVVLYDGVGTLQVGLDASMVSTSQGATGGRDVFNVATPNQGIWLCITNTNSSNHLRNIRVVKAEDESLLNEGEIFNPTFLSLLKNFRVIRAMQWLDIDNLPTPPGNWADRPQVSYAGWGSPEGVPLEVVISLCNALSADCWINIPHTADDNYITQMATLVHQQLGSTQKVYVEFSNEVWNGIYPQYQYAAQQGQALWGSGTNAFDANRNWYGMRTAQMCDIWAKVWGSDFSRVHCVLGGLTDMPRSVTEALDCPLWSSAPCYKHHVTDIAIAPYFGWPSTAPPSSWATMSTTDVANQIFAEFNSGGILNSSETEGVVQATSDSEAALQKAIASYNLPLIAYEGGQSIRGFPDYSDGSPIVNAYIAANRDPRMGAAYSKALEDWKANGGRTYVLFDDIDKSNQYGEWGLLESVWDTVSPLSSAPAKWQAVQNFIASNPCWWSGCTRTIAEVPQAPTGFKASK